MAKDSNTLSQKQMVFVGKGRKLALGALLVASAVPLHSQSISPELEKILKSPEVPTAPHNDCVEDNSPRTMNLFIGGFGDQTFGQSVLNYHNRLISREAGGIRRQMPCNQYDVYVPWDSADLQKEYIERTLSKDMIVNLIGHSFGGNAAIEFAGDLKRKINLLVTIDPVQPTYAAPSPAFPRGGRGTIGRSQTDRDTWQETASANMAKARANVKTWVNVLAAPPEETKNFSDTITEGANKYGTLPVKPKKFVDAFVTTPQNHGNFGYMMGCHPAIGGKTPEELLFRKKITDCSR